MRHKGGEGLNLTQYGVKGNKESVVNTPADDKRRIEEGYDLRNKGLFESKSTEEGVNKTPFTPVDPASGKPKLLGRSGGRKSRRPRRKSRKITRRR